MEGHQQAFEVFGGTPVFHFRYDNLKAAVSRVLFGRNRTESACWVAFRSHHNFDAFTDTQADQLRPYLRAGKPGVIVATDADDAGHKAAVRAFWQLTARGGNPPTEPNAGARSAEWAVVDPRRRTNSWLPGEGMEWPGSAIRHARCRVIHMSSRYRGGLD